MIDSNPEDVSSPPVWRVKIQALNIIVIHAFTFHILFFLLPGRPVI